MPGPAMASADEQGVISRRPCLWLHQQAKTSHADQSRVSYLFDPGGQSRMSAHKKSRTLFFFILFVAANLALAGCRSRSGGGSAGPDLMAQVNGYKVLRSELDKGYNTQVAGAPQKPSATEEEAIRLQIL